METLFLDERNINLAFNIRRKVFIEEQNVPETIDIDGSDKYAKNMVIMLDNIAVGTGRLIEIDKKMYIGRIAVLKEYRNRGIATNIINALTKEACNMGYREVFIHAQISALQFYKKLNFKPFGDKFLEANIPHINMKKNLEE